jgi:hypothetical protein
MGAEIRFAHYQVKTDDFRVRDGRMGGGGGSSPPFPRLLSSAYRG